MCTTCHEQPSPQQDGSIENSKQNGVVSCVRTNKTTSKIRLHANSAHKHSSKCFISGLAKAEVAAVEAAQSTSPPPPANPSMELVPELSSGRGCIFPCEMAGPPPAAFSVPLKGLPRLMRSCPSCRDPLGCFGIQMHQISSMLVCLHCCGSFIAYFSGSTEHDLKGATVSSNHRCSPAVFVICAFEALIFIVFFFFNPP